jgi:hypothetical protein
MSGGGLEFYVPVAIIVIASQVVSSGADMYLAFWTDSAVQGKGSYILNYTYLLLMSGGLFFVRTALVAAVTVRCAANMQKDMLRGVVRARVAFFEDNASGRILSRAGKDQELIDKQLPGEEPSSLAATGHHASWSHRHALCLSCRGDPGCPKLWSSRPVDYRAAGYPLPRHLPPSPAHRLLLHEDPGVLYAVLSRVEALGDCFARPYLVLPLRDAGRA